MLFEHQPMEVVEALDRRNNGPIRGLDKNQYLMYHDGDVFTTKHHYGLKMRIFGSL